MSLGQGGGAPPQIPRVRPRPIMPPAAAQPPQTGGPPGPPGGNPPPVGGMDIRAGASDAMRQALLRRMQGGPGALMPPGPGAGGPPAPGGPPGVPPPAPGGPPSPGGPPDGAGILQRMMATRNSRRVLGGGPGPTG